MYKNKIFRVLKHLKKCGNPYYQFYDNFQSFKARCKEQDNEGHQLIFGDDNEDNEEQIDSGDEEAIADDDEELLSKNDEVEETDNVNMDTIRRHQFDHNRNTYMTNNYPEMLTDENERKQTRELSFAPAEGNHPTNILNEKDWDIKSWPALHPDGRFGHHHKRKTKLTYQYYFCQRILNQDQRFSKSPGFIFAAAAYIEQKQLTNKANISYMRGKKGENTEGKGQYNLEAAFTIFDGIKNTPKYWQKVKFDMIAKLEIWVLFTFSLH